MRIYLYTENFVTNNFDLYQFSSGALNLIDPLSSKYTSIMSEASGLECDEDVDANGVSVIYGLDGFWRKTYVAFKVLINEVAPCGRKRLVFGFTEPSVVSEKGDIEIRKAMELLMQMSPISMPEERLTLLEKCVAEANKESCRLLIRSKVKIAAGAIAASIGIGIIHKNMQKEANQNAQ